MGRIQIIAGMVALLAVGQTAWSDFAGWEGMRVIRQESPPGRASVWDLDGDGRDELIVVNTRQSRLEVYEWLPADQRKPGAGAQAQADKPNELPMAPEFGKVDVPLRQLPLDVLARDIDGDGTAELIVLVAAPSRILVCRRNEKGKWVQGDKWDLLPGQVGANQYALLAPAAADGDGGGVTLLISFNEGIQQIELTAGSRADWLKPREAHGRAAWWLVDLDRDGDEDLLEWTHQANESVRWYARAGGRLLPATVLHKEPVAGVAPLATAFGTTDLVVLEQVEQGLLRRFTLGSGDEGPLGRRQSLPLVGGGRAVWCGMLLAGEPVLVAKDEKQPRLNVSRLTADGWVQGQDYPIIADVRALAAPASQPGALLLWAKDAADLYESRWAGGRLTFPKPMPQSADVEDRRVLALGSVGGVTWWVQRVAKDADLYVWRAEQDAPQRFRFEGVGDNVDQALWLGEGRLLFREKHKQTSKLATIDEAGKTTVSEPSHIKKAPLSEFRLIAVDDTLRPARLADGVLQWLDDALQPADQVMLPQGRQLADYVALADGRAWALERQDGRVHLLKPDAGGILRVAQSMDLGEGTALLDDPVLGLILVGDDRITRLAPGVPPELTLAETLDSNVGRDGASREDATIHRISAVDITGDGQPELILHDDQRHQMTALARQEAGLVPTLSWPVFEDKAYPYGYERQQATAEPRLVLALDVDGDGQRDLALLCHDRLIFYLAREQP